MGELVPESTLLTICPDSGAGSPVLNWPSGPPRQGSSSPLPHSLGLGSCHCRAWCSPAPSSGELRAGHAGLIIPIGCPTPPTRTASKSSSYILRLSSRTLPLPAVKHIDTQERKRGDWGRGGLSRCFQHVAVFLWALPGYRPLLQPGRGPLGTQGSVSLHMGCVGPQTQTPRGLPRARRSPFLKPSPGRSAISGPETHMEAMNHTSLALHPPGKSQLQAPWQGTAWSCPWQRTHYDSHSNIHTGALSWAWGRGGLGGTWAGSWVKPLLGCLPGCALHLALMNPQPTPETSMALLVGSQGSRKNVALHLWGRVSTAFPLTRAKDTRVHLFNTHCPAAPLGQARTGHQEHRSDQGLELVSSPRSLSCSRCGSKHSVIRYISKVGALVGEPLSQVLPPPRVKAEE